MDEQPVFQVMIDPAATDDTVALTLVGELDPATAPQLEREALAALFSATPSELVLDFEQVSFMDSAGVRALISLHHTMRERDGTLVLVNVPATPRRILEVSGLTDRFELR
jgi:anti-anti-sigma factor